ncbi:beta-N-acetylhexosaminidase [Haloechinothrix alba]|uniref:Beta-N-acetylhexosaminidase n=1 Tax=Haloechinothrix alba TaxID=664784 RepID=A0A238VWJ4_9PSEU|nr:glycoside hydrolase family 3 N-terminal domain-containing protein [Haloechinothrix alba]SNR38618.1 beta-N-acetylhexosaminidase [Haloechinothrix alba]
MTPADPTLHRMAATTLLAPFTGPNAPSWLCEAIADGLGGVCLFAINGNVADTEQLSTLSTTLSSYGQPVIAIDEEGGDVTRLAHATGSPYPGNAALGAIDDTELTRAVHRSLGAELDVVGINLNLAPSGDVNTATDNPVIGTRSFGSDARLVSRHTGAAVRGLQEAGVAACVKHFPGHGATRQDSHHELPTIDISMDMLTGRELAPFRAAVTEGAQAIMTAHVRVPVLTGTAPATLSPAALEGLLRERMGYDGLVVSDALEMQAISDTVGIREGVVRSLLAGADLLCLGAVQGPDVLRATTQAIVDAVRSGRLRAGRLEEAASRVRRLHAWRATAGRAEFDGAIGLTAARQAVLVTGEPAPLREPLVVEIETPNSMASGSLPWGVAAWIPGADAARVEPSRCTPHGRTRRSWRWGCRPGSPRAPPTSPRTGRRR